MATGDNKAARQPQELVGRDGSSSCKRPHSRHRRSRHRERLWQLPESSVHDYARWIEKKGATSRTEAEQKFFWKYQRRCLIQQDKLSTETLTDYVFRLLQKKERTQAENHLILQFQRRRAARRESDIPQIRWKRNRHNAAAAQGASPSALALASNMATLRESMDKMGLSSQKLRDANMES